MFNMANHRYQLIITGDLPTNVMNKYKQARLDFPNQYFTLGNASKETLSKMLDDKKFKAVIDKGLPPPDGTHFITDFELTNIKVVVKKQLDSKYLAATYPQVGMPFYLYGSTQDTEYHIDHTLAAAPNTQFTAGEVTVHTEVGALPPFTDASPYIDINVGFPERAMQPFPSNKDIANDPDFFFRPDRVLPFTAQGGNVKGRLTLAKNVFVDTDMLNEDPVPPKKGAHVHTTRRLETVTPHTIAPYPIAPDTVAPGRRWHDIINDFPRPYDDDDE